MKRRIKERNFPNLSSAFSASFVIKKEKIN